MKVPVLAAPTASGKTGVAIDLAKAFPLEIISADAMLVYKDMNIGTAKPTLEEQAQVKHHLINVVRPDKAFSVADYVRLAEATIADVVARGKLPLVVGGTGFYIRALSNGIPTIPAADFEVQQAYWDRFEKEGLEPLLAQLESFSKKDAERSQRNPRRVIRALEIIKRTGKAPWQFPNTVAAFNYDKVVLLPGLDKLKPRIAERTQIMLKTGWMDEVRNLLERYPSLATAKQALGYDLITQHLQGDLSFEDMKAAIIQGTTKYAKRQHTWFRKEPDSTAIPKHAQEAKGELQAWLEKLDS